MMKQSIYDYMKLGTIAFMSYPSIMSGTGDDILPVIKKLVTDPYFTAIEVSWIKDPAVRKKRRTCLPKVVLRSAMAHSRGC